MKEGIISEPVDIFGPITLLLTFWDESLSAAKIIRKLEHKEKISKTKLSDKEFKLKQFLKGESNELLQLAQDSTTRKYGELAVLMRGDIE